jgi:hypothetical protein
LEGTARESTLRSGLVSNHQFKYAATGN